MTENVLAALNVSRETQERLRLFEALVQKWSQKINLVSSADLPALWQRHILDSAQLARFTPDSARNWMDIGTGGGFPGLVLALLHQETHPELSFTLVESDGRKSAFLIHAARELGLAPRIITERVESLSPQNADILSARALAPLTTLLTHASRHLSPKGVAIFPKGRTWQEELADARNQWQFAHTIHESLTDPQARILIVEGLSRA